LSGTGCCGQVVYDSANSPVRLRVIQEPELFAELPENSLAMTLIFG
jgi:hypothetical protein